MSDALSSFASESSLGYVRNIEARLDRWSWDLPTAYDWVSDRPNLLKEDHSETDSKKSVDRQVRVLAEDMTAYGLMQLWKIYEMAQGAIHLLNRGMIAASSAPARSAMESTISLTEMVMRFTDAVNNPKAPTVANFTSLLNALIWGGKSDKTRLEGRNVLTLKDSLVGRLDEASEEVTGLTQIYAELCDVVHPSSPGHRIWRGAYLELDSDKPRIIPLRLGELGPTSSSIVESTLWAISWSSTWGIRNFGNALSLANTLKNESE